MTLLLVLASLAFSLFVAFAFRALGPKWMAIAGAANFALYMTGIWLAGGFGQ